MCEHLPFPGHLCLHECWGAGYDRTEDNIDPIMHYCEEACTRCLAIEQDTKRKVNPFTAFTCARHHVMRN